MESENVRLERGNIGSSRIFTHAAQHDRFASEARRNHLFVGRILKVSTIWPILTLWWMCIWCCMLESVLDGVDEAGMVRWEVG